MGRALGALLVAALLTTGCSSDPEAPAEPEATKLLRTAVAEFKKAGSVHASFTATIDTTRKMTGDAEVIVGTGDMSVAYTDALQVTVDTPQLTGELISTGGSLYQRWAVDEPLDDEKWVRRNPAERLRQPLPAGFRAKTIAKLLDPTVLLDTGLDGLDQGKVTRADGSTTVAYDWFYFESPPREPLKSWSDQTEIKDVGVTLTLDSQGRATETTFEGGSSNGYRVTVKYTDYGKPVTVKAPL